MSLTPFKLRQAAAFLEQGVPPLNDPPKWPLNKLLRDAADEIESLRVESVDKATAWDKNAEKNAKITRLCDVLKPFADAAGRFAPYVGQMEEKEVNAFFTLAQLRAAAAALNIQQRTSE